MSIDVNVQNDLVIVTETTEDIVVNVSNAVGPSGPAGVGVPVGGATNQVLKKLSATNYDTYWAEDGGGIPYSGATGAVNLGAFSLTANSIIKSGGTSSQFLKADGSVDSSAYITGITSGNVTTALGFTPVPTTRTITINGTTLDLSADRSYTVAGANIYTADGTLTGDRVVALGGFTLSFTGSAKSLELSANAVSNLGGVLNYYTTGTTKYAGTSFYNSSSLLAASFQYGDSAVGETGLRDAFILGARTPGGRTVFVGGVAANVLMTLTSAGRLLLGTVSESTFLLDVNGTARVSGDMVVNGFTVGRGAGNLASNSAFGFDSLKKNTTGINNTGLGIVSLGENLTGSYNTSIGSLSMRFMTGGSNNSAVGHAALSSSTTSNYNTALGNEALGALNSDDNTGIGFYALRYVVTGGGNTALGSNAGRQISGGSANLTSSSNSVFIGLNSKALADSQTNQIVIGYNAVGLGSNTTTIGNSSTITTALRGRLLLGITTDTGLYQLDVNGTARVSGDTILSGTYRILYFGSDASNTYIVGENNDGLYLSAKKIEYSDSNIKYGRFQRIGGVTSFLIGEDGAGRAAVASSILELFSSTQGFLPPRMTTTQINAIASPAEGLMAYNTTISHMCVYQAGAWVKLSHSPM